MKKEIVVASIGLVAGILATSIYFTHYNKRTSYVLNLDHYRCVGDNVCVFSNDSVSYLLFYGNAGDYKVLQLYDKKLLLHHKRIFKA